MAEDLEEEFEDEPDFEGDDGEGGGKKKKLLFVVLPLLLIIGGAVAAYLSGAADPILAMLGGGDTPAEEMVVQEEMAEGDLPGAALSDNPVFYDLPEMLVNLNASGRRNNFLKIRVSLELRSEQDILAIETFMPRIVDNFQVYLRELRLEDLQGAAGMYRLREELLMRVNAAAGQIKVNDVLFKEMIVQ